MNRLGLSDSSMHSPTHLRRAEEILDAHLMGPRLQAAIGAGGQGRCHVLDAKYEPGVRCTVLYRAGDRLVRGDLVGAETVAVDASRPVVAPGLRLSCFPDDPDLPRLAEAADRTILRDALRNALPGGAPILRCRVDLVRYRPGRRATLAVELRGSAGWAQRFVVKSYHDGGKAAAVAAEAVLLDATVDPSAPLRFAPVRAHLPALSVVVQEHVTGARLDELTGLPGPGAERAVRRAAVALAALHRQPVVTGRTRPVGKELARFTARGLGIAAVAPSTGTALVELATRLAATAGDVGPAVLGLVHGDCKPSQFLLRHDHQVVLLDLDSCGQGDPAGDVGTFLATLRQQALRRVLARRSTGAEAMARVALADAFLDEYVEAAGAAPSVVQLRRRITWYEAVALERKALRCFARAPRSPLTRALVDQGHARLDRLGGGR